MLETISAAADQPAPDDLISFLKAIPDGRYRRGVRYPQSPQNGVVPPITLQPPKGVEQAGGLDLNPVLEALFGNRTAACALQFLQCYGEVSGARPGTRGCRSGGRHGSTPVLASAHEVLQVTHQVLAGDQPGALPRPSQVAVNPVDLRHRGAGGVKAEPVSRCRSA